MNAKTPRRQGREERIEGKDVGCALAHHDVPHRRGGWCAEAHPTFLGALGVLAFILLSALTATRASAATPREVDAALTKATAYLYAQQNDAGTWEKSPKRTSDEGQDVTGSQWGGPTALATYALLAA